MESVKSEFSSLDFVESGWKDAVKSASFPDYFSMADALDKVSRVAGEQGRSKHEKILQLLSAITHMEMTPESTNEPFKPFFVSDGKRTMILDDLKDAELTFLGEVVDLVDDNLLKARIADVLWLRRVPRNVEFAIKAINAYKSIPIVEDSWFRGGEKNYHRAIVLARLIRKTAVDAINELEKCLLDAFFKTSQTEGFFALSIADLLKKNRLGNTVESDVATKLESLATDFQATSDHFKSRRFFEAASEWYKRAKNFEKAFDMKAAEAESYFHEAEKRLASHDPSHMVAASFYENAIQTYRQIPKSARFTRGIDERILSLHELLSAAGEEALNEMGTIQSQGIDITRFVENARELVSGKSASEAFFAFVEASRVPNTSKLRQNVIDGIQNHPLQFLMPATFVDQDGRVVAKRPGINISGPATAQNEIAIRAEMVKEYGFAVKMAVASHVWPALEVLLLEHRIQEAEFIYLAKESPIVPKDRGALFGKALFAGYERDFITAIHLLVPQIEHMVRFHLKNAGVQTTTIDSEGIENEVGLSALMDKPEVEAVFGRELSFEIRSLFCDPLGANLRNEVAHGLLEEGSFYSEYAIYAWWFALRLTFLSFWNAPNVQDENANPEHD